MRQALEKNSNKRSTSTVGFFPHVGRATGHRRQHASDEKSGGGLDFPLVAGRAESTALAEKDEQIFLPAMIAADAGNAEFEIAAVEASMLDLRNDGPQRAKIYEMLGERNQNLFPSSFPI